MADEAERFAQRATQLVEQRARDAEDFTQEAGAYVWELSKGSQSDPAQSSSNAQAAAEFETKARALVEKTEDQKIDEIMRQRGLPVSDKALRGRIIAELRNTGTVPDSFQETPNGPGHLFTSLLPEPALNAIGNVPVVGKTAEDVIGGVTSPLGLMTLPGAPASITAKALAGSLAGGVIGEQVAGDKGRMAGEVLGGLAGPVAPGAARMLEEGAGTRMPGQLGSVFSQRALNRRGIPGMAGAGTDVPNLGGKPPAKATPDPIDAFDDVLPTERPSRAALAHYEGRTGATALELRDEIAQGNKLLSQSGQRAVVTNPAKPTGDMVALYKALHGEGPVPPNLRSVFDDLKARISVEEAATREFDPRFMAHPDYFPRGWRTPKDTKLGPGKVATTPGFAKPRNEATFSEMLEAGWEPATWNPYDMYALRRIAGAEYREQRKLIDRLKATGEAVAVDGPVPSGWRAPRIGPAFEGKPYAREDGSVAFTPRVIVPDELAGRLENMFGTPVDWGKLGPVDIHKTIMRGGSALKRVKLIGGLFQQADFAMRSGFSAFGAAADDLLHGRPVAAASKVAKLPATLGKMAWANASPSRRAALRQQMLSTEPFLAERPGLTPRSVLEAGWQSQDISVLRNDLRAMVTDAASQPSGAIAPVAAVQRRVNQLNQAIQRGLFEGVYPQAQIEALRNFIVPRLVRAHPDWTDAQIARSAADEVNKMFSTIGNYQTVLGSSRNLSDFLHSLIFSTNEAESLIKQALSTVAGPNKGLWAEFYLGGALFLASVANVVNLAATGKPLDFGSYAPIRPSKYSTTGIEYNPDFMSPDVPKLKGRGGFPVKVDLVMQMDTVLRLLDPVGWVKARENVGPRAVLSQIEGKDFYGRPFSGPKDRITQAVSDLGVPIPAQNIAGIIRDKVPGADQVIPEGESRLGSAGLSVQAGGLNLRAQTNRDLLDMSARDWAKANGVAGVNSLDDLPADQRNAVINQPSVKDELDRRQATSLARGDKRSQFEQSREDLRSSTRDEQGADDAKLQDGTMSGETWRKRREDRLADTASRSDQMAKDMGLEFKDKDARFAFDKALNEYYAVKSDDYTDPATGEVAWDGFFAARDAALKSLSADERRRFDEYIGRNLTPTEKRFQVVQGLARQFYEKPKYTGLDKDDSATVDAIRAEANNHRLQSGGRMSMEGAIRRVMKENGVDRKLARIALLASRGSARVMDTARDEFLIANPEILRFYPTLANNLSNRQKFKLPNDIILGLLSTQTLARAS